MNVRIRPFEDDDRDELLEALRESQKEVGRWMSWCHEGYGPHDAQMFINYAVKGWENDSHYEFAVRGEGRLLGAIGINQIIRADRVANLGYWIRTSASGLGVCTRAVELGMDYAWERTDLNRLEIVIAIGNEASRRVAQKVDALFEGVQQDRLCIHGVPHDAAMYALLRTEHHVR